jgi:ATP-binding cassette subfamily F protein 3
MIAINSISFEFGGRYLYRDANWHIKPNERIGLIGKNGTGKTTLLRLITGEYQVSEGTISMPKNITIGFLNQDQLSFETEDSILNVALSAFEKQLKLEVEIEEILKKMETDHSDEIIQLLTDKQHEFEMMDGYNLHHKCEKVLEGLGFTTAQLKHPYKKFSGGWRMRVMLAKMLLQNPDVLMLDEPTNHLDLPTIIWLEEYLQSYNGTVIVVSHDREFLNRMITKTVEVANQKITEYPGNYSFYLEAKAERTEMQQRQFDNQQQFIKDQEKLINRFKAKASKASMAQSRIKMLDKLDKIEAPEEDNASISIDFRIATQSGKVVAELKQVSKSFPDIAIMRHAEKQIMRGDKIALIGANGKGKSTLLRMIAGTEPFEGEIVKGYNLINAFYAQHQLESLNLENDILEEMKAYGGMRTETELRTLLGCFLFTNDDVFKKIKVLSGGEKARVALARTLLTEANFLLLDEPTNHLDMRSIHILIQALQQYQGSFLVVSHDRYFVSQIANKIWWFEDEELKEYPGTYEEYEYWRNKRDAEKALAAKNVSKPEFEKPKAEKTPQADTGKKPSNNQLKKLQDHFNALGAEIDMLKKNIAEIEMAFNQPEVNSNSNELQKLNEQHYSLKQLLQQKETQYEQAFEELATLS